MVPKSQSTRDHLSSEPTGAPLACRVRLPDPLSNRLVRGSPMRPRSDLQRLGQPRGHDRGAVHVGPSSLLVSSTLSAMEKA